jgi:hypothetical protein
MEIQNLVETYVDAKVAAHIKKCEQPEHFAKANQLRLAHNLAQRRDRERNRQKPQRPISGGMLQELRRIAAQVIGKHAANQHAGRNQADKKHHYLRPFARQNGMHIFSNENLNFDQ